MIHNNTAVPWDWEKIQIFLDFFVGHLYLAVAFRPVGRSCGVLDFQKCIELFGQIITKLFSVVGDKF